MELICPSCQQTLRVGDSDAGKQARCPKCQTVFAIPGDGGIASDAGASPSSQSQPDFTTSTNDLWHLRIEDGRSFGPVPKAELDQWLAENRITANCFLRRDQDSNWLPAGSVYTHLGQAASAGGGYTANPFGDKGAASPYQSPQAPTSGSSYLEAQRGGLILTLGILGFCCCFCGIAAWIMGAGDLKKMDQGRMDPDGRGLTMAGYILGIVSVILNLLSGGIQALAGAANF